VPVTSTQAGAPRGRRLRAAAAATLVVALALLALLHARGRFEGAVVGADGGKVYVAREGQPVRLRFVDRERGWTAYRVLASTGSTTYALAGRTGRRGAASRVSLPDVGPPSRVSVRWMVGRHTAARWVFLVRAAKRAG
jgi:hypothetical protein